jgi:hypothetical protein
MLCMDVNVMNYIVYEYVMNYIMYVLEFSAPTNYGVVKIARSNFKVVLWTMKYTMIYPGPGSSSEIIALCTVV